MVESVLFEVHRIVAAKRRKRQKAEDQDAASHIHHRFAEKGIGPGQAGRIAAAVELVVDSLEEDSPAAVADYKRLAVGDILTQHIGPEVGVGRSPVVEGMESDLEVGIAPGELPGNLAEESL